MAQTLLSTRPRGSPYFRTACSVMSVVTPDARLGHAIQSPPLGASAACSLGSCFLNAASLSKNATTTSNGPLARCNDTTLTPSGSSPRVCKKPSGAPASASRAPGLSPSFWGSGVPE